MAQIGIPFLAAAATGPLRIWSLVIPVLFQPSVSRMITGEGLPLTMSRPR